MCSVQGRSKSLSSITSGEPGREMRGRQQADFILSPVALLVVAAAGAKDSRRARSSLRTSLLSVLLRRLPVRPFCLPPALSRCQQFRFPSRLTHPNRFVDPSSFALPLPPPPLPNILPPTPILLLHLCPLPCPHHLHRTRYLRLHIDPNVLPSRCPTPEILAHNLHRPRPASLARTLQVPAPTALGAREKGDQGCGWGNVGRGGVDGGGGGWEGES